METPLYPLPEGIGTSAGLSHLTPTERAKHHTKQLGEVAFYDGANGVARYKQQHPDAARHRTHINAIAYVPKPQGYDDYLVKLADGWLSSREAAERTNIADVENLNAQFGGSRFDPANHFSKVQSRGRLAKLKAKFLERGVHLDTEKANTLSKVKAVARASRARQSPGRPFGAIGIIADGNLIVGDRKLVVMDHHGHEAIKLSVGGKRTWLRLDVLAAALDLLGISTGEPPSITTTCSIGDVVPEPEIAGFDPLAALECGELVPTSDLPPVEMVPEQCDHLSLAQRVAAVRANQPLPEAHPDDVDPLTLT